MKLTLLLLLFFTGLQGICQSIEIQKIKTRISRHPQQDTSRVNLLNELALDEDLVVEEIKKSATEALFISRKINYPAGEGLALLNLAAANFITGKKQESAVLLKLADSISKRTADRYLEVLVLMQMAKNVQNADNKSALMYALKAESTAQKTGNNKLLSAAQRNIADIYQISLSDYPRGIEYYLKSIASAEKADCLVCLANSWTRLGGVYNAVGDQENSLLYYQNAADANKKLGNKALQSDLLNSVGGCYLRMGNYSGAIKKFKEALEMATMRVNIEIIESNLAEAYVLTDSLALAFEHGFKSLAIANEIDDTEGLSAINAILARAYFRKKIIDSAINSASNGLSAAKETGTIEFMRNNAEVLADAHAFKGDFKNAYEYYKLYISYRDTILNTEVRNKSSVLQYNYNLEKKQSQINTLHQQKKLQDSFLISLLSVLLIIGITAVILLRNNRQKQKANVLLQQQKEKVESTLKELKLTQAQLIQSEKMASLGELTAGIAHEIQNPLNFVNNFSEVNEELLRELKTEAEKGNLEEIKAIAKDIEYNSEKIIHHGKRADAIVKGMLQHSQTRTGQKEATDINKLANEYLRLSYQGLRAKDKLFNATLQTDFDETIGSVTIIPQDIGRVLLNIYNNAFYAVAEKKKLVDDSYEPKVSVTTKKIGDKVEIKVADNGNGIPQKIVDKIFQPFFSTKPTGQGTGLGLSLAYDIIKAHGGEIKVEIKEGEGSEFVILLPVV